MAKLAPLVVLVSAATMVACGPGKAANGESDPTSSEDSTASAGSTTQSAETSTTSTTSTGPSTGPSTGSEESESAPGFAGPQDSPPTTCDAWSQDCPEGEKCVPYANDGGGSWNAVKCVPVMGEFEPGEACKSAGIVEATDDCDATSFCWSLDPSGDGICRAFCTGSPDDPICPPSNYCPIAGDGVLNLCFPNCDPLAQDCEAADACYWVGDEFSCVPTTQDIPLGEACGYINDCEGGLICVDGSTLPACDGEACCTSFCALDQGDVQCEAMPQTSCVPFFNEGEAPAKYVNVGVCVSPP